SRLRGRRAARGRGRGCDRAGRRDVAGGRADVRFRPLGRAAHDGDAEPRSRAVAGHRGSETMIDLASTLSGLQERRGQAPWPDHEYVRGWGVFGLPFDSGHVLALRVIPENDFSAYRSIWHRAPDGRWSIHVHGPRLDTACPRYFGSACAHT